MNRRQRQAARVGAESLKQNHALRKQQSAQMKSQLDSQIQEALKRPRDRVWRIYADESPGHAFLRVVREKAPRLQEPSYEQAILRLAEVPRLREPQDWVPVGKGRETLFRSLCSHTLMKYPVPQFLWSVFFDGVNEKTLGPIVARIAAGESFFQICKTGDFPIPLTRAQIHALMSSSSDMGFMKALRRIQVKGEDGDQRLFQRWVGSNQGATLHNTENEVFWLTVLRFFAQNPMLDLNQMGPLIDYIAYRRGGQADFSMKGRSATALLRGMQEWHGDLRRHKELHGITYSPSGFQAAKYDFSKDTKKGHVHEVWSFIEILSSKELLEEGKIMHHCVYSYSSRIASGGTSIWSLRLDEDHKAKKVLTLEVHNAMRSIVQARGLQNRKPEMREEKAILKWAGQNNLGLNYGRFW